MPCYTVKKTTVNVSKMDLGLLAEGLKAAGFSIRQNQSSVVFSRTGEYLYHTYSDGALTISGSSTVNTEALTNEVKRAYSAEVVRKAANQFGWRLNEAKPQQFVAQKRR